MVNQRPRSEFETRASGVDNPHIAHWEWPSDATIAALAGGQEGAIQHEFDCCFSTKIPG